MQVNLTIDRGNTALKAALWDGEGKMLIAAKGDESLPAGELAKSLLEKAGLPSDTLFDARKLAPGHHQRNHHNMLRYNIWY